MVLVSRPSSEIDEKVLRSRVYRVAAYIVAKKDVGFNILEDQFTADKFYDGEIDVRTLLDYAKMISRDGNIEKIRLTVKTRRHVYSFIIENGEVIAFEKY